MKQKEVNKKERIYQENNLFFELNESDLTAKLIESPQAKGSILIPKSITINSCIFQITSIGKNSFKSNSNIRSITFPKDSELKNIEGEAFYESSLTSLFIPSKVQELNEGWCRGTSSLINITVSPQNKYFSYIDDKFLVSTDKCILFFVRRDIKTLIIPSYIKQIASDSISYCQTLKTVQFQQDVNIFSIEKRAFSYSLLESISIPLSVVKIEDSAFAYCKKLKTVTFSINSQLDLINQNAFCGTLIESITIPSTVTKIDKFAFYGCSELKKVDFYENSQLLFIDKSAFADSMLEDISIPSKLSEIGECAFYNCKTRKIEFPPNSELKSIGSSAFSFSLIETILLPKSLACLNEEAFSSCENLVGIEFLGNNIVIKEECFYECENLCIVSFPNAQKIKMFIGDSLTSDLSVFTWNFAEIQLMETSYSD